MNVRLAWTSDAYDFFCVSLSVNRLSETFFGAVSTANTHKITQSITLTLLFRLATAPTSVSRPLLTLVLQIRWRFDARRSIRCLRPQVASHH